MKTVFRNVALAIGAMSLIGCATTEAPKDISNKKKAVALISSIETGDPKPIGFVNPNKYIQHNLAVGDGLAGFAQVMNALPKGSAKAKVIRAFQDGDYVFLHTQYDFFGPKAGFDIFRFEEGKIVEHWDNLQSIAPANPSGRTQFDGPTKVRDLEKTDLNKRIVADFVDTILVKGDLQKISQFIGENEEDYLQHNPNIADGLSGLNSALTALAKQGMPVIYSQNHIVLGEGNFVLSVSEGTFLNEHVAFYDLFRLHDGMIVEHWDTIEAIPAEKDRKNGNGKFNF